MKYEAIEKGIEQHDIKGLREAIGSICYTSRDFSSGEFDEAVRYVEKKGIKIKDDSLIGELVSSGKTDYTDEDFARAVFELKKNFCDDRIEDVKKIGKSLYKPVQKEAAHESRPSGTSPKVQSHQKRASIVPVAVGVLVAVVIVIIIIFLCLLKK